MSGAGRAPSVLSLGMAGVLATAAGFVLGSAFELYRSPSMVDLLESLPLC